MGALRISCRLWRITVGLSLPESLSETSTAACLFTPLSLFAFASLPSVLLPSAPWAVPFFLPWTLQP